MYGDRRAWNVARLEATQAALGDGQFRHDFITGCVGRSELPAENIHALLQERTRLFNWIL